ncbi:substrate-binding domain-containing protein [Streptomyces sp. 3MP-14]|uniref:Substrate-binding domain-containing protein n=1 Tax=Streptomyces mimosae TaxID=2586635 RepID=A0A5N6ABX6_9ACTN|nr:MULTISPECIES: LacI family DNA-binding transcriptional regulator [Streptomyces]KAB8165270.1 substrate-binding domain-containing protein [Streptomyces mimosae]KAB8175902.1 substrate-binding domain-containing protein [Streptomyces sp. 3MP-14]
MTRPTLAHIAEMAGVSVSTVSKVLNGRDDVSRDTRAKVDSALRQHHYVRRGTAAPDATAVRTVDLVMSGLDGSWPASVASGMEAAAYEAGVHVAISVARSSASATNHRAQDWVDRVLERGSAGVVLGLIEPTPDQLGRLAQARVPCVVIDPLSDPPPDVMSVGTTNWAGAYEATQHLLQRGHQRIALVTGPPEHLYSRARMAGYRSAMAAAGLEVDPELVRHGTYDRASGAEQVRALLERRPRPTALFICSDHMAIGGYEAIAGAGLRVPEDISVVGFDDLPEARWVAPALTTVRQPLKEMGGSALRTLVRLMNGEELESPRVELATTLVVRDSVAPRG